MGRADQRRLAHLYELNGTTPEQAAQEGLSLYIKRAVAEIDPIDSTLEEAVEASRASTIRRSEYQE